MKRRKAKESLEKSKSDEVITTTSIDFKHYAKSLKEVIVAKFLQLPPKWRNLWTRGVFGIMMMTGFAILIRGGPLYLMFMVLTIQVSCFHEITRIGFHVHHLDGHSWYHYLNWYFLLTTNYVFYGEMRSDLFANLSENEIVTTLLKYHRMISLTLYLVGFIYFVLRLAKEGCKANMFYMFAWTHVTLIFIVCQSQLSIHSCFDGMIWLIAPVSMVVCNDIIAYFFGFFFGKTQLIEISPKKTWEGFIGGGVFTVILGWFFSGYLSQFPYLTCPPELSSDFTLTMDCQVSPTFFPAEYKIPVFLQEVTKYVGLHGTTIQAIPFQFHCLIFSLFSSIVAPFGGFFASGLKRAFRIKDFGTLLPGHGGSMDRNDCQALVVTFVHVYMSTFIKIPSPSSVMPIIISMEDEDKIRLFDMFREHLHGREL